MLAQHGNFTRWRVRRLGHAAGWSALRRGVVNKESVRLCLVPMNYWRYDEIPVALSALDAEPGDNVLNVASPYLSSIALAHAGVRVTTLDILSSTIGHQQQLAGAVGLPGLCRSIQGDARQLPYDDDSFTHALAISSLEHIPDDDQGVAGRGDVRAVRELFRVLRPGGRAVISVPYTAGEPYIETRRGPVYGRAAEPEGTFFQRHYSEALLAERLLTAAPFTHRATHYVGERPIGTDPRVTLWSRLNHPPLLKPVYEVLSPALYPFFGGGVGERDQVGNPIVAVVVLDKDQS